MAHIKAPHIAKHHAEKFVNLSKHETVIVSSSGDIVAGGDIEAAIAEFEAEGKKHFIVKQPVQPE